MKLKLVAVAVTSMLAAGVVNAAEIYNKDGNKLDLYGKVTGLHYFSDDTDNDGDKTYVRLGFKGETQIANDLIGYGQWEYKTFANDTEGAGNKSFNRLAYAGLKYGEYGSFDYGRNYGVVYDVEAWTDMLPVFGGDSYTWTDNFMNGRANGLATYRNQDFFGLVEGLNFALQYQGTNEGQDATEDQEGTKNGHDDVRFQNGDGFGMSTIYDFDFGLSLGAAYSSSDRTNTQVAYGAGNDNRYSPYAGGERAEAWTIGAKYDAQGVYLAMMYAETRNMTPFGSGETVGIANKTQNFEAVAQYQFDFGLRPSLAWVYSKGKDIGGNDYNPGNTYNYVDQDLVNYIDLGMTYSFNKNFSTYVDYKINLLDNDESFYEANGISTDDIVGAGMTYQF